MRIPVLLPDLGAERVRLSLWLAQVGDLVYEGDRVAEVLIPGATFDVPAPATGVLRDRLVLPRDPLVAGQVLGVIEEE